MEIIKQYGPAIATAAGGWVGAALNFKRRLSILEKSVKATAAKTEKQFETLKKEVADGDSALKAELKMVFEELKASLKELEDDFERFERASISNFAKDSELSHLIEENQKRWEQVHRTLGQIEGLMRNPRSLLPPR